MDHLSQQTSLDPGFSSAASAAAGASNGEPENQAPQPHMKDLGHWAPRGAVPSDGMMDANMRSRCRVNGSEITGVQSYKATSREALR